MLLLNFEQKCYVIDCNYLVIVMLRVNLNVFFRHARSIISELFDVDAGRYTNIYGRSGRS